MQKEQLQRRYGDEQVLVVTASSLQHLPAGLQAMFDLTNILPQFVLRYQAEGNPTWRQLIPYIVLRQDGRVWLTQRLQAQGESRLHHRHSLGVGGHINPIDADAGSPLRAALYRELREELDLGDWLPTDPSPVAIINDLSNAVNRDHLGVVYILDLPPHVQVSIRERDKMSGRWAQLTEIRELFYNNLEDWSKLVLEYLEAKSE